MPTDLEELRAPRADRRDGMVIDEAPSFAMDTDSGGGATKNATRPFSRVAAVLGGFATAGIMIAAAWAVGGAPEQTLQAIPAAELEVAAQSLLAGSAASLVGEAKACKRALGVLTLVATGPAKGRVRFSSGGYMSPFVKLGATAERVALPFPAAPEIGHGQIGVEGENDGIDIFLRPGFHVPAGRSSLILNVRWDPRSACR